MTRLQRETTRTIAALGLLVEITEHDEYRITKRGLSRQRAEAIAYYTQDAEDAIGTAKLMRVVA